jgi:LmbE family N-acetylglucosaminyl deacetylase
MNSLLAVFAHPDDKLFSARLLADRAARGARVTLVTATKGEAGRLHDSSTDPVTDVSALRVPSSSWRASVSGLARRGFSVFVTPAAESGFVETTRARS